MSVAAIAEIPQPTRERLEQIGAADLVIAVLAPATPEALEAAIARSRESVASLNAQVRTVLIHPGSSPSGARDDDSFRTVPIPAFSAQVSADPAQAMRAASDTAFSIATNLGTRAVAVIVSDLGTSLRNGFIAWYARCWNAILIWSRPAMRIRNSKDC